MRSPNSVFRPLERGQNFAGFNQAQDPGVSELVMNQNPDVQSLMLFLQSMQERGTLPQGFNMNMPQQGGMPPGVMAGDAGPMNMAGQQGGMMPGGPPSQPGGSAMPMPMNPMGSGGAGQMPMPMDPMGSGGAGAMGAPPPMPGMGSPGAATMSPMMFGMPASPFATPANALAPAAHLGPQLYGQPMSDAQPMRAADVGMQPGPAQRFRDSLGQMGRSLEASYEADPGRFFRMMAAVSTGKPGVALEAAQDEAKMAEASALRREQMAARTSWETEQNRTRLQVAQEQARSKQDQLDLREVAKANIRAEVLGIPNRAVGPEDLPELSQAIGKAQNRKKMVDRANEVIGRALKGQTWMPREVEQHFADDPEFGEQVRESAMKAQLIQEEISALRKATTEHRNEQRKLTGANVRLANNPEWQIAMGDYREAMGEMRRLQGELADVAGQDFMGVEDNILDMIGDLEDRIAETQARLRAAASAPVPAATTTGTQQPAPATTTPGSAPPPRRKGKSLRDVTF